MTSSYHIRNKLISDILPEDLTNIVSEYVGIHHRKEWTRNLMKNVCENIEHNFKFSEERPLWFLRAKKYGIFVHHYVDMANTYQAIKNFNILRATVSQLRIEQVLMAFLRGQPIITRIPTYKLCNIGILRPATYDNKKSTIKKPPHIHCEFCHRKDEPIFLTYRIHHKDKMMCHRCDIHKRYTFQTKKGFRSLSFELQAKIIHGLNDNCQISTIYKSLSDDEKKMSYSTLCKWRRENQMR